MVSSEKIPRVIHYCWFGGAEKPAIVHQCIASWKKYLPSWKIIEWNDENYDTQKCAFIREAYEAKKWAFVSDFARFDVINQYGGVYFDTDVELLKPLPDFLFDYQAFSGYEYNGLVNPGLVYGAIPNFQITNEILHHYENSHFHNGEDLTSQIVNVVTSRILNRHSELKPNTFQVIEGMALYPAEYFCAYDQDVQEPIITERTIALHHYASSWRTAGTKDKIKRYLKRLLGVQNYRKLLKVSRKITGRTSDTYDWKQWL